MKQLIYNQYSTIAGQCPWGKGSTWHLTTFCRICQLFLTQILVLDLLGALSCCSWGSWGRASFLLEQNVLQSCWMWWPRANASQGRLFILVVPTRIWARSRIEEPLLREERNSLFMGSWQLARAPINFGCLCLCASGHVCAGSPEDQFGTPSTLTHQI